MIDKAMAFIVGELNNVLLARFEGNEKLAVLSSVSNPDGTLPPVIENKLVVSLINIEREGAAGGNTWQGRRESENINRVSPPFTLNLLLLITASFSSDYAQALKALGVAMGLFQGKPSFNPQNSPDFPAEMEKLSMELVNMSIHEVNNVWAILGAKYMPSVIYKMRMLVLQENWISDRAPAVSGTGTRVQS